MPPCSGRSGIERSADFGTRVKAFYVVRHAGYSSLEYLQRYPLDALKIDRSFVNQIGRASGGTPILEVIALATT